MVKQLIKYQCEICNEEYDTKEVATNCEVFGTELPLVAVGDMIKYEIEVNFGFPNIFLDLRVKNIEKSGHFLFYTFETEHEKGKWVESLYEIYSNAFFRKHVVGFKVV